MRNQSILIEKLITKKNELNKLAKKRTEKLTKKIENAFFYEYDGDMYSETKLLVLYSSNDNEYFYDIMRLLNERGIETHQIKQVLTDKKGGTYPTDYYERCKNARYWAQPKLWYAMELNAKLNEQAKTMINQQPKQPVRKLKMH